MSDTTDPPATDADTIDLGGPPRRRAARAAARQVIADFEQIATQAGEQAGRRQGRIFGVIGLIAALVVSFLAGGLAVDNRAELAAFRQQQDQRQLQIDDALAKLREQNEILIARGQAPVKEPAAESTDPMEAIAALVLSRVIAQLPPPPAVPTADEIAAAITPAVTANVWGPSQQQLTRMTADYYRSGGPGEAAIEAAVRRVYAANPPRDGESPPCLSEPQQCRGEPGAAGAPGEQGPQGPAGPAGPVCEPGTHVEDVMLLPHMKKLRVCVVDDPDPDQNP